MNEILGILDNLISVQSDTHDKIKNISDYICDILDKQNVVYKRIKHTENQAESIIAAINANDLRDINSGILLSGHMDTVSGDAEQFLPTHTDGKIYGRGAVDMKYFIAVVLALIPEFKKQNFPIVLTLTGDEETDVTGIKHICEFMQVNNIHPQMAIVGEPTNMDTVVAHNGYCGYSTTVFGAPAHASQVDSGINAIYFATEIISYLRMLAEQYQKRGTTINVGRICGGTQRNTIAGTTTFDWEIRYASDADNENIIRSVTEFQNKLMQQTPGLGIQNNIAEEIYALKKENNSKITKVINTTNKTSPIATEAGFLQKHGIDTVVFGAGNIQHAHTTNEYIEEKQISNYADALIKTINSFDKRHF